MVISVQTKKILMKRDPFKHPQHFSGLSCYSLGVSVLPYFIFSASCSVFSRMAWDSWDTGFSIRLSRITWKSSEGHAEGRRWSQRCTVTWLQQVTSWFPSTPKLTAAVVVMVTITLAMFTRQLCRVSLLLHDVLVLKQWITVPLSRAPLQSDLCMVRAVMIPAASRWYYLSI